MGNRLFRVLVVLLAVALAILVALRVRRVVRGAAPGRGYAGFGICFCDRSQTSWRGIVASGCDLLPRNFPRILGRKGEKWTPKQTPQRSTLVQRS